MIAFKRSFVCLSSARAFSSFLSVLASFFFSIFFRIVIGVADPDVLSKTRRSIYFSAFSNALVPFLSSSTEALTICLTSFFGLTGSIKTSISGS